MDFLPPILISVGFAFLFLFLYAFHKERNRLSKLFSVMCLICAVYVFGYAFELRSQSLEQIKFFITMEYFGLSFIPV